MGEILLTPGPTPLPPEVQAALGRPIIHHRSPEYRAIFTRVLHGLQLVMQTDQPVYLFTSSGTGAMEAAVRNVVSPGHHVAVIVSGKWGERWRKLCETFGAEVTEIQVPYGEAVDPSAVEQILREQPDITAVFATLCETSTGVVHDLEAVGGIVGRTDAVLVVDAISGLLADPCQTDAWGIDVLVGGSQKALMVPPGLSFLSISRKAWSFVERSRTPRFYFDLQRYRKAAAEGNAPFTSSVPLVVALDEALRLILNGGVTATLARCRRHAEAVRAGMEAMGLALFAKRPSNALTAAAMPSGIDGTALIRDVRARYHVRFADGQGEMAGTMVRIAHLGAIGPWDLVTGLTALELGLVEQGVPLELGHGPRAAAAILGQLSTTMVR